MTRTVVAGKWTTGRGMRAIAMLACVLAAGPLHAAGPEGQVAGAAHDCAEARALPADADVESRRIACTIPEPFREDVAFAEFFGRQMRLHDIAAWLTTDALREIGALENRGSQVGWLTGNESGRIHVRYFAEVDEKVLAIAEADLDLERVVAKAPRRIDPGELPAAGELHRLAALKLALGGKGLTCGQSINTITFEFERGGRREIRVYLLSATSGDELIFGGHHLVTVSADGTAVLGEYAHTKSCLVFDPPAKGETLGMSHLTSPTPNEFHVFLSLQYRMPIYVSTAENELMWKVDAGRISLVADPPAPAAAPTPESPR